MDWLKVFKIAKKVGEAVWYVGVPLVRAKYPAETAIAESVIEQLKDKKKERKDGKM